MTIRVVVAWSNSGRQREDCAVAGLDLTIKADRLLAENVTLVSAELEGAFDIANLG